MTPQDVAVLKAGDQLKLATGDTVTVVATYEGQQPTVVVKTAQGQEHRLHGDMLTGAVKVTPA